MVSPDSPKRLLALRPTAAYPVQASQPQRDLKVPIADPSNQDLLEREAELALLGRRLSELRVQGPTGGCVLMSGEAGVGKTTLLHAARFQAGSSVDWLW